MIYASGTLQSLSHTDRGNFTIEGFPGNVYVLQDNSAASTWVSANSMSTITKSAAQTLVNNAMATVRAEYDAASTEEKTITDAGKWFVRPQDIVLP